MVELAVFYQAASLRLDILTCSMFFFADPGRFIYLEINKDYGLKYCYGVVIGGWQEEAILVA